MPGLKSHKQSLVKSYKIHNSYTLYRGKHRWEKVVANDNKFTKFDLLIFILARVKILLCASSQQFLH